MTALYTVDQIRAVEQAAQAQLPAGTLMQRAGEAVAKKAVQLLAEGGDRILILAGPGNNGGDALEAAWRLADGGSDVTVILFGSAATYSDEARQALERARDSAADIAEPGWFPSDVTDWHLVIDGLFGIGLKRPIAGTHRATVEYVNKLRCPILAIDVPSGLDADAGTVVGPDGVAIRATHTITFIGDKPGLHTASGRDYAGCVHTCALDIDSERFPPATMRLNDVTTFASCLKPRRHDSHKGTYGDAIIVGGAHGMTGAPMLAARAAACCGAGRVYAAFLGEAPACDAVHPELMCRDAQTMEYSMATVVAGPGLGTSSAAHDLLRAVIPAAARLILDADALNLISTQAELQHALAHRAGDTVLTPHPLEAARLLGTSAAKVQADRIGTARALALRFNAVVVLKGSGTIVAVPHGDLAINTTGNPGLATAGSGDVLAGICGALLAQGWPAKETALGAVWLHGRAADVLVEQGVGPIGLTAGELIPAARRILNALIAKPC